MDAHNFYFGGLLISVSQKNTVEIAGYHFSIQQPLKYTMSHQRTQSKQPVQVRVNRIDNSKNHVDLWVVNNQIHHKPPETPSAEE